MKILIKSSFLLCFILCGFIGNAQQQWKVAKLVTVNSDTIQGQINFGDWNQSPHSIQFKDEQGNVTSKSAQEIKSFSIQEPLKTFESKNLKLSYYSKEIVAAGASPIVKTDSVIIFLEVLLKSSRVTLYEGSDDEKQTRFFLQKDDRLHELRNPVYRVAKGETSHMIKSEVYKAQLKQLLQECPTLNTERLKYNDKDLVDLLVNYHSYCKTEYKLESRQEVPGQRFAIGGIFRHVPKAANAPSSVGVNALLFSKKNFNSLFVSIDIGFGFGHQDEVSTGEPKTNRMTFGLYGGKYFGLGDWHPMIFTGISNTNGALDTGVGLSFQRIFAVSTSVGLIYLTKGDAAWSLQLRLTPFANKQ
jgi:hypothetical protein